MAIWRLQLHQIIGVEDRNIIPTSSKKAVEHYSTESYADRCIQYAKAPKPTASRAEGIWATYRLTVLKKRNHGTFNLYS